MKLLAPLGRLLFSTLFIISGMSHFTQFRSLVGYARASGVPLAELSVVLSGVLLVGGGLCVLFGMLTRVAALGLIGFLVLAALLVHDFWTFTDPQQAQMQLVQFLKNLSLAGGAVLLVYYGPGPYSVRATRQPRQEEGAGLSPRLRPRHQG